MVQHAVTTMVVMVRLAAVLVAALLEIAQVAIAVPLVTIGMVITAQMPVCITDLVGIVVNQGVRMKTTHSVTMVHVNVFATAFIILVVGGSQAVLAIPLVQMGDWV